MALNDLNEEWLGHVQPVGLVVASVVLARLDLVPSIQTRADSEEVRTLVTPKDDAPRAKRGFWPRIANKARSEILSDVDVVVAGAAVSLASGARAYFALFRFAVKLCSSGPK